MNADVAQTFCSLEMSCKYVSLRVLLYNAEVELHVV